MCVCVCVWRERECVCVCVCRERERECVCVCVYRERESVCVCAERERERVCLRLIFNIYIYKVVKFILRTILSLNVNWQ